VFPAAYCIAFASLPSACVAVSKRSLLTGARGELSYARVRALTRVATPETEERLLKVARVGTGCIAVRMASWNSARHMAG
jgi:hypothetical protein